MTNRIKRMVAAAICLALCYTLPFLTGQIQGIGRMLCPMHLPVFICGFVCGRWWGFAVGFVAPLLRSVTLGMPPMFPDAVSMAVELAVYGFAAALIYDLLPKKLPYTYVSLISAMLCGRVAWGAMRYVIAGISKTKFTFPMFLAGAFTRAFPGIIVQLLLVPAVIELLRRTGNISRERNPERVATENPLQAIDK